jgi:hypothetical protein
MNEVCAVSEPKGPASNEIMDYASRLASISKDLEERVESRLSPITRPSCPKCKEVSEGRAYPPLFDDLRNSLNIIEQSLNCISDTIDRTEL